MLKHGSRNAAFENVYYWCYGEGDDFKRDAQNKNDGHNMLAAGDSWFCYMDLGYAGLNVVEQFSYLLAYKKRIRHRILNLAVNGSHATHWQSTGERVLTLRDCLNWDIDFLLFSGGGNDIIDGLEEFLPDDIEVSIRKAIDEEVRRSYESLLKLCYDKGVKMVTHCYCFGEGEGPTTFLGIPLAGPWLGEYNKNEKEEAERLMIEQMKEMLQDLKKDYKDWLIFADTSALKLKKEDFNDQLHLTQSGCKKVAKVFYESMKDHL